MFPVPFFRVQGVVTKFLGAPFLEPGINSGLLFSRKPDRPIRGLADLNISPKTRPGNGHHNTIRTSDFNPGAALENNGKRLFVDNPRKHGSTDTDCGHGCFCLKPARRPFGNGASHHPENTFLNLRFHGALSLVPVPDIIRDFHFTVAAQAVDCIIIENDLNSALFSGYYHILYKDIASDLKSAGLG